MDDDYDSIITKKPLKLICDKTKSKSSKGKKRKQEESVDQEEAPEEIATISNISSKFEAKKSADIEPKIITTTITKAEAAFRAKQTKIAEQRILKKAAKTHKQRVEEFNKHLDSLSEHYDIPKVSWTK